MSAVGKRRRREADDGEVSFMEDEPSSSRSHVAHAIRNLITDTKKHHHEYVQPGNAGLIQTLDKADGYWKHIRVGQCREAALDSTLLRNVATLGVEQARILNTNLISFDALTFGDHLISFMRKSRSSAIDNDEEDNEEIAPSGRRRPRVPQVDWSKLGKHCHRYFRRRAPTVDFMYGPMALEAKERKAPQRRQTQPVGERVVPQQLISTQAHEEATTREVERISRLLSKHLHDAAVEEDQPIEEISIAYFDFVLHPTSFSQTVENIFHFSFLVKDGLVCITTEDDQPYIHLNQDKDKTDEAPRSQMIVSLDKKDWRELVAALGLEGCEPAIPERSS